ncbi:toxin-antitoxin system, antitoxin component [Brevundimonas nasdae]|uniref:Toxin-antitoxin system, antitoxin component n=1 Tax=Brevundimonas nasdae TaxID=172043 RepID=A0ACD4VRR4_9CAUL|nr:toxin-antitoxin system, antitoxin component [Brevundimonas nasdae]WOB79921.1 toxin-antitoxin system, antitoxin component [Brevundimonas nasdae]
MAKYAPLASYLRRQKRAEVDLTFRDIERIVGGILPKAATADGWWRAEPAEPLMPQHIAFADAGFVAEPQTRAETVHFVRMDAVRSRSGLDQADERGEAI